MNRRTRADEILDEWAALASTARPPALRRGVVVRSGLPFATFAGAAALALVVLLAGSWLGRLSPNGVAGGTPSINPAPTGAAPSGAAPTGTAPAPTATSPVAVASPSASGGCDAASLAARITAWEGAAGSRIADVELKNTGSTACELIPGLWRPQLVDGRGEVLIDGRPSGTPAVIEIAPGEVLKTLVEASNLCSAPPVPPVSVAFADAAGDRIVASPLSPTDATVPPCNGSGVRASITMQEWTR